MARGSTRRQERRRKEHSAVGRLPPAGTGNQQLVLQGNGHLLCSSEREPSGARKKQRDLDASGTRARRCATSEFRLARVHGTRMETAMEQTSEMGRSEWTLPGWRKRENASTTKTKGSMTATEECQSERLGPLDRYPTPRHRRSCRMLSGIGLEELARHGQESP